MAINRFDVRTQVILDEANDIQTTCLRAQLLPESFRAECGHLLQTYVESRIAYHPSPRGRPRPRESENAEARTRSDSR